MFITRLRLKNWRNFLEVDVPLERRTFIIGPNASGKSNLLDAIRFLRDVATSGLDPALTQRGEISKIRALSARSTPGVTLEIHLGDSSRQAPTWRYQLAIRRERAGRHRTLITSELVWDSSGKVVLQRPDQSDEHNAELLTQTHLEQVSRRTEFSEVADFLRSVHYLHLVPQLIRYGEEIGGQRVVNDPFGQGFLARIVDTPPKTRDRRLRLVGEQLQHVLPQFSSLGLTRDEYGRPHLEMRYDHWRPNAGLQREDQFSDGTLRLIGLLWSLMERGGPLLLEEPELSLQGEVIRQLAPMFASVGGSRPRQTLVTTHSYDLIEDSGIDPAEILLVEPSEHGSTVSPGSDDPVAVAIAEHGDPVAGVLLGRVGAAASEQQLRLLT